MKYVIIGNSAAGIGAAEGIRKIDRSGEVTIISKEPYHTYSRPLISYLLLGKVTQEKMKYRNSDFYEKNNIRLLYANVAEINAKDKQVILSDGEKIAYDKLLVATGSSAWVPPFEGLDSVKEKFTFMSLDDAKKLGRALNRDKRVLIIGAGLIGLKCAEGILKKTAHVTVADLAPRILSSILDEGGARRVQKHLEGKGIEFKLSSGIRRFEKNTAVLESGEKTDFDVLVLAVGVRPNTALLKDIALIERGIIVNEKSETNAPDIYAAGDCTQIPDVSDGQKKIMALLPNACMQGECAGVNMAGGEKTFDKAIPMNAIGFFGLPIFTAGNYRGDVYAENDNGNYKRLFYGAGKLNGYILIGNAERVGIYTGLIRERTALDSIDFPLLCKKTGLMAFAKEERMARLGENA